MKSSASSFGSMSAGGCANKLRFLTLVVNTADVINERTTLDLGITHLLIAPTAIFSVFILLGCFVVTNCFKQYPSNILQSYVLFVCGSIECILSYIVFKELIQHKITKRYAAVMLNGILPMIIALLLVADFVITLLDRRRSDMILELPNEPPVILNLPGRHMAC